MKVGKIIFFCEYIIVLQSLILNHNHKKKLLSCYEIFVGRPKAGNQTSNIKSSKVLSNHLKVSQYCWGLSVKLRSVFSAGGGRAHGSHRSYYPASRAVVHFSAQDFVSFQFFKTINNEEAFCTLIILIRETYWRHNNLGTSIHNTWYVVHNWLHKNCSKL